MMVQDSKFFKETIVFFLEIREKIVSTYIFPSLLSKLANFG